MLDTLHSNSTSTLARLYLSAVSGALLACGSLYLSAVSGALLACGGGREGERDRERGREGEKERGTDTHRPGYDTATSSQVCYKSDGQQGYPHSTGRPCCESIKEKGSGNINCATWEMIDESGPSRQNVSTHQR